MSTGEREGLLGGSTRRELLGSAALVGGAAVLAGCGADASSSSSSSSSSAEAPVGKPKRGGDFRVAATGGGPTDTIVADQPEVFVDSYRALALYDALVRVSADNKTIENKLAEEITPNADGTKWTIRLKPELEFHDGQSVTSADVISSLRYANRFSAGTYMTSFDLDGMKAVDKLTVTLPMKFPTGIVPELMACSQYFSIIPANYDPKKPVGTGPFVYQSFSPGERSVFTRNPNYWDGDKPYVDTITIIDVSDATAGVNAVQSGQADAFADLPDSLVPSSENLPGLKIHGEGPGVCLPFWMRVDKPPFNDQRVREAFTLIPDRQATVEQAVSGQGVIGNDLFCLNSPLYNKDLPQREQDIEKAKSLLKQAGQENMTITLTTAEVVPGMVALAEVLAQQAKAAGVTINIENKSVTSYYGGGYLSYEFSQDSWDSYPLIMTESAASTKRSPYNSSHFANPQYNAEFKRAFEATNLGDRTTAVHNMQEIFYKEAPMILPIFQNLSNLVTEQVQGVPTSNIGEGMGNLVNSGVWLS